MALTFTNEQVYAEGARLGLVADGEPLSDRLRSQAAASLARQGRDGTSGPGGPQIAKSVTVRPGRGPLVDGRPFPWAVTDDPVHVEVRADGTGFVRLTIPADLVRIDADTETPQQENRA